MLQFKQLVRTILVILSILSLSISLVIVSGSMIYRIYLNFDDLATPVGLSTEQLMVNFNHMMKFLILPNIHELKFPDFSSSAAGIQHFVEVKHLMLANFILSFGSLIFLSWNYFNIQRLRLSKLHVDYLKLAVYFPLFFLFIMVVAFDKLFVLFHQLFFNNDLWLFNPLTDPIIYVLPENVFMIYVIFIIIVYELLLFIYRKLIY